jgi:hypothetical protein
LPGQSDGFKEITGSKDIIAQKGAGRYERCTDIGQACQMKNCIGTSFPKHSKNRPKVHQVTFVPDGLVVDSFQILARTTVMGKSMNLNFRVVLANIFRKVTSSRTGNSGDKHFGDFYLRQNWLLNN